ncbi:hypothetical protein MMC17_008974 [Xylographa soralifera]|nr:hypothetical protein [Xylographa soralifera]
MSAFWFLDIIEYVLQQVYDGDPQSLTASALVSRDFHRAASPLILQSITIHITSPGTSFELPGTCSKDLLTRLNKAEPHELHYIHTVHINVQLLDVTSPRWSLWVSLLSKLNRCKDLYWTGSRPPDELALIVDKNQPQIRLHLMDWGLHESYRWSAYGFNDVLRVSPNFYELKGSLCSKYYNISTAGKMNTLQMILSSPGLRKVDLMGCRQLCNAWDLSLPRLTMPADDCQSLLEEFSCNTSELDLALITQLSSKLLFNNLRLLETNTLMLLSFDGCQHTLRCLRLWQDAGGVNPMITTNSLDNASNFLKSVDKLEELQWRSKYIRVPLAILQACGPSLRTLVAFSWGDDIEQVDCNGLKYLERLRAVCPNLTHFSLNIVSHMDWSFRYLKALASFPMLTELSIIVGDPTATYRSNEVLLNTASARRVFWLLRMWNTGQTLKRLVLKLTKCGPSFDLENENLTAAYVCWAWQSKIEVLCDPKFTK